MNAARFMLATEKLEINDINGEINIAPDDG